MRTLEDDSLDELVRAARPAAPSRLAGAVVAALAARRRARLTAIGIGAVVLASAAVLIVTMRPPSGTVAAVPATHEPAGGGRDAAPAISDARTPSWTDLPALIADLETTHHDAIAACVPAARRHGLANFRLERAPDGSGAAKPYLIIHHSLGYLGYSAEERCLADVGLKMIVPPLPEALVGIAFTLDDVVTVAPGSAWQDPVRTGMDAVAPVRARLAACAADAHATVAFEPWHGTFRARVMLDDHAPMAMQKCVARVGAEIEVPALPGHVDQIVVALTLR
jgi:stage V sporulation protein SpoVS